MSCVEKKPVAWLLMLASVLLVWSISLLSGPVVLAQSGSLVERLENVATLIRNNKINDAEIQLASILKAAPDTPVALNLLGTIRAKQGRLNEAETLFLRAIQIESKFVGARMNLAYVYLLQRAPEKTIVQLKEVLRLEPEHPGVAEKLAELLLAQGRIDECISFIAQERSSRTIPIGLQVLLGDAYLAKGSLKEAEENYLLALEGRLENVGALLGLAEISRLKGETRETFIYLKRVSTLTTDSKSPELLYKFGFIALKAGVHDEAKSAFERSLTLRPNDPTYLLALGVTWLRKGDLFEAEKVFRRLVQVAPNSTQGQLHLGYVLLNQKKYREAREWLERSAKSNTPAPEVFYYLGLVAQEQNDDAGAIALFEKAVQKLPSYSHARIALGSSYIKLRNYERARQELEEAVRLDPDEPKAHYNLALLYSRLKDPVRAQEQMRIIEKLKAKGIGADSGVIVLPPISPER
jgi:Flp pilus assembly protein TadD